MRDIVRTKFDALAATLNSTTGRQRSPEDVAEGFLKIAVDNMAHAIKHISVERGYDVTEYTLCCFGGAGGQHACAVADALGMTRVFIHPLAGVLSAYGMGLADVRALRQFAIEAVIDVSLLLSAETLFATVADAARGEVEAQGIAASMIELIRTLHLKYEGTDTTLEIPYVLAPGTHPDAAAVAALVAEFERRYSAQYGFLMRDKPLVVEAIAVEAVGAAAMPDEAAPRFAPRPGALTPAKRGRIFTDGAWRDAPVYLRESLRPDDIIAGPAVIAEKNATTVIEPGWKATLTCARPPRPRTRGRPRTHPRDRHDRRPRAA